MKVFTQRRRQSFVLLLPLLAFVTSFCAAQEECTVGPDGECIADDDAAADTDTAAPLLLPEEIADDGLSSYVETGFGEKQLLAGPQADETRTRIAEIVTYMKERVFAAVDDKILQAVASECQLRNELCAFWAVVGECEANPAYMKLQCAPACYSCESLSFESRCPMPENLENIWAPGNGLNAMFEKITTDAYYKETYDINVLLQPGMKNNKFPDSPWVVVIDNFLTETECDTLIELGAAQGYEQSKDVGAKKFDGTYDSNLSAGRTSTNAWCLDACFENPVSKQVIHKIENITGIPDTHAEYLQLLKYEEGQFYETHHDYIDFHVERAQGVRILTVFLYLNDVEEGGGTNFPLLDMTVEAKRGRALLWPSVKDQDPDSKDPRTDHQALPVIKGVKYGANAWLHLRDFKTPFASSCI